MPALAGATNVFTELDGSSLTISVDLSLTSGTSKSGKTETIATTAGNKPLGSTGAALSLNVNLKTEKAQLPKDSKDFVAPAGMKNLTMELHGSTLKMKVDMTKDCGPSSTGKSVIIATTSGAKAVGDTGVIVNLNIFCKDKPNLDAANTAAGETPVAAQGLQGIQVDIQENMCTFVVDTSKTIGDSKSGKTVILATSNGFAQVPDTDVSCNLIVCKNVKAKDESIAEAQEADLPGSKKLQYSITGTLLRLKCDLSQDAGKSSTGKSVIVASTSGLRKVPNTALTVNLTVYKSEDKGKRQASELTGPASKKAKNSKERVASEEVKGAEAAEDSASDE